MKLRPKQIAKWNKIRQMGRRRYVRLYWVLGWGLTTAVVWSLLMAWDKGWSQLPIFLALAVIGFPIGGIFLGRWMWAINERAVAKAEAG